MILSDEPGYYEDGNFGIRIETLVRVVPAETKFSEKSRTPFLTFTPVTVVPIQVCQLISGNTLVKESDLLYPDQAYLGGTDDEARGRLVECLPPDLQVLGLSKDFAFFPSNLILPGTVWDPF